jgi:hypothetical protein
MRKIPAGEQTYIVQLDDYWMKDNVSGAMRRKGDKVLLMPEQAVHLIAAGQLVAEDKEASQQQKDKKSGELEPTIREDPHREVDAAPAALSTVKPGDNVGNRAPRTR